MVFIKDRIFSLLVRIKEMNKTYKMVALAMLGTAVAVFSMAIGGVRLSYDVIINGEKVAQISDMSVYREAEGLVLEAVAFDGESPLENLSPKFRPTLTVNGAGSTAEELSASIIANSSHIVSGFSVCVDGENKLYVSSKDVVNDIIDDHIEEYDVAEGDFSSRLSSDITYCSAYVENSMLADAGEIERLIDNISVVTTVNKVSTYTVPFETVTTRTSSKKTGYVAVTTAGVNGVNEKKELITYVNGVQTDCVVVSDTVVSTPINEEVTVGTGNSSYSSVIQNASTKGYIWPLAVNGTITSYWGDGRNHKGLDIVAPAMTDIYAVKEGKVTYAGWKDDYGYNVIIDHGNGVQTRYAHCSKLIVKTGDTVSQGDHIAEVGTTGQSTGNHLHFEVIINGTRVNPSPYLGV